MTTAGDLLGMLTEPDWHKHAACYQVGNAVFYPASITVKNRTSPATRQSDVAYVQNRYCNVCPVIDRCAEAASDDPCGIWAGTLPDERVSARRALRARTG